MLQAWRRDTVSFCSGIERSGHVRVTIPEFWRFISIRLPAGVVMWVAVLARRALCMYRKVGVGLLGVVACQAQAKVDPVQPARLGADLTPLGAERAGNAQGTIPAWTGGVKPPAHYELGMHHPDPYADDAMLYRVD